MSEENIKIKSAVVDEIKGKLDNAESVVVIDYIGTTVEEANAMRKKLREADVDYKVYKNTLMKRAFEGTDFEGLTDVLDGPSALAVSHDDATAPARVLNGIFKEYDKMAFKAGYVEGTLYDADGMQTIASVPSRDELIAKFMGSIQSPVSKFVRTLQAIADDKPADGEEAPAAEAAPAAEEKPAEEAAPAEEPKEETPAEEAAPAEEPAKEEEKTEE